MPFFALTLIMPHYFIFTKKYQTLSMPQISKISGESPLFSIVTITRNNLAGIKATHGSLQSQNMRDFEWIVIDGASTDGSLEYLAQNPPTHLHSAPDNGIYDAMNTAIPLINGLFCLFLNAGDQLAAPSTLTYLEKSISGSKDWLFIYGDSLEDTNGKARYKPARSHQFRNTRLFTHHQSMLYAAKRLKSFRYNTDYPIAADYDLTLRFLEGIKADKIMRLDIPIALYEAGGISQTNAYQGRVEQFSIRRNLETCPLLLNIAIFVAQWLAWRCRQWMPALYWGIKSRRS